MGLSDYFGREGFSPCILPVSCPDGQGETRVRLWDISRNYGSGVEDIVHQLFRIVEVLYRFQVSER